MRIRVLGCSGGIGPGLRTTSLLVDDETLIDAGTGVGDLPLAAQKRIRRVFLTHAHLDHVCGLAFMADNLLGLVEHSIEVTGLPQTIEALRRHIFNWSIWPDFGELPGRRRPILQFRTLEPGRVIAFDGVRLRAFEAVHTVPAVGYALEDAGGSFAFTGDTFADARLWRGLNALPSLDRLMIEVAFADEEAELGEVSRHFTPAVLGAALGELRHRPELLLTHHKPGSEADIARQCREALAGWKYRHLRRGDLIG